MQFRIRLAAATLGAPRFAGSAAPTARPVRRDLLVAGRISIEAEW